MRRRAAESRIEGAESPTRRVGGNRPIHAGGRLLETLRLPAVSVLALLLLTGPALADSSTLTAPPAETSRILILEEGQADLDALLTVPPAAMWPSEAEDVDARIAAAVARGSNDDLKPRSGFRKRKLDLFRAERQVEIADQEMVLRLRLRAKRRETMRVELRF